MENICITRNYYAIREYSLLRFKGKTLKITVEVISVPDYQKMYTLLFNAATDAIEALEAMNLGQARAILVLAQQQTEEIYLDKDEDDALA